MSKKKYFLLIISLIIIISSSLLIIVNIRKPSNKDDDFTKIGSGISKLESEKFAIKEIIYQFRKNQFLDQLNQDHLAKFDIFMATNAHKFKTLEDYLDIYLKLIEVEKQLEDSDKYKYCVEKSDECYEHYRNEIKRFQKKNRFHQIKEEIENYNYLMTNFFNLYLAINNNYSDNQNDFKTNFNQKFVALFDRIENDIRENNFSFLKAIVTLQSNFEKFKKNPDSFNTIIDYIEKNFYGQTRLIANFKSFITKQQKISSLQEKKFFALVGCPSSGKTTFVKTVTQSLNLSSAKPYYFEKIPIFNILRAEFGNKKISILLAELRAEFGNTFDSERETYVVYLKRYLLKTMRGNFSEKMVVLFDLDQVPPAFFDYFITSLAQNNVFDNLIIFLSFSSSKSFASYQYVKKFGLMIKKNTMQTYNPSHMFDIFNRVLIPKKVNEFKNNIFDLLQKKQIINNNLDNDDELKTKIFANFDITVYERRFLFFLIVPLKNKNKIRDFDVNCDCEAITNLGLETIAGKIVNMSTANISEKLSAFGNEIALDDVLNILNFNKTLKEDEYKDFMIKERNNYRNIC